MADTAALEPVALVQLRKNLLRFLIIWLWLHVPLIAAVGTMVGSDNTMLLTIGTAVVAVAISVLWFTDPAGLALRLTCAVGYPGIVAFMVAIMEGHPWQMDLHMYFFASLAFIGAMCDWRAILLTTLTIAIHHLTLNFIAPVLVFLGGTDTARVILHAGIVIIESGALLWMARFITSSMTAAEQAQHQVREQAERTNELLDQTEQANRDMHAALERAGAAETQVERVRDSIGSVIDAALKGDFSQRVELAGVDGVAGTIGVSVNKLTDMLGRLVHDLARVLDALDNGNLGERITVSYDGRYAEITGNMNQTADQLADIVGRIYGATDEVSAAIHELNRGAETLASRSEHQASSLEQTTATIEELSATVRRNAENAHEANEVASAAREAAAEGGLVVNQAVAAMGGIEESSRQISEIVGLIQEIAFQTNLLALNASVEAARAGEAGRGFSVVADEVRALAQRSAQASKNIKDLITGSGSKVQDGVRLVNDTGNALQKIVASVKQVADYVSDIASASQQQTSGIDQVSQAIGGMDEITQQNASLVEETSVALRSTQSQVDALRGVVSFFERAGAGSDAEREPTGPAGERTGTPRPVKAVGAAAAATAPIDDADDWVEF
jgi:methyl-accepting chemotaxis protein